MLISSPSLFMFLFSFQKLCVCFLFLFLKNYFIFGLSCGMWDLQLWHVDFLVGACMWDLVL